MATHGTNKWVKQTNKNIFGSGFVTSCDNLVNVPEGANNTEEIPMKMYLCSCDSRNKEKCDIQNVTLEILKVL